MRMAAWIGFYWLLYARGYVAVCVFSCQFVCLCVHAVCQCCVRAYM